MSQATEVPEDAAAFKGGFLGLTLSQWIILALPLVSLLALWLFHAYLPNKQIFLKGQYFDRFLTIFAVGYGLAVMLTPFLSTVREKVLDKAPLISVALVLVLIWDLITLKYNLLHLPHFPGPGAVVAALATDWQMLGISLLYSLRLLAVGYFFGLVIGLPTGVLMGWFPRFNYWASPFLRFIGPIPATAWIPIVLALFPTSFQASIFLIALASWFPITVMTWSGVANVQKSYYEVAKTLGASELYLIARVAVPASMPSIFVGLFMGLGTAFVTLVVAELLGVKAGLGWYIQWAQGWAEYVKVYGALVVMAVVFSGIITLLFRIRDRVLVWQKGIIKW